MKAVCIEPFKGEGIRYGISYDVVNREFGGIKIINDFDKQHTYKESRFITLEEWRERQLNEILDL